MHEKIEYLFAQKSQRQNKLPLPMLNFLPQILFNKNFSIGVFTISIFKNFNRYV